jgi:hypothetical protein
VNPEGGNATGIVVFASSEGAANLLRASSSRNFVIQGTWVSAQRFRNEGFARYQPKKSDGIIVPPPIMNGTLMRWIRNFVMANAPKKVGRGMGKD